MRLVITKIIVKSSQINNLFLTFFASIKKFATCQVVVLAFRNRKDTPETPKVRKK